MSVEDDVARINAVTEKLAGPQLVWVLIVEGDNGTACSLFATEALARAAWKSCLLTNYQGNTCLGEAIKDIASGHDSCECPHETWWSLREREVATS